MFTLICQHLYGEQIGEYAVSQSIKEWNQNAFLWGVQGYEFLTFHRFLFWQSGIMLKSYTERFDSLELSTILKAIDDYRQKKVLLSCVVIGLVGMPCCIQSRDRALYPIWIAYAQTSAPKRARAVAEK